jgi:ribosomal protein S20
MQNNEGKRRQRKRSRNRTSGNRSRRSKWATAVRYCDLKVHSREREMYIYKEVPNVLGELSVEQDHKGIHLRQSGNGLARVHVKI